MGSRQAVDLSRLLKRKTGQQMDGEAIRRAHGTYLFATARSACLDAVAALDHVGLEGDGTRAAVQLQEQTAGIA